VAFVYKTFDIAVARDVNLDRISWPQGDEAGERLGCNRQYKDLRRLSWADVERLWDIESRLSARIECAANPEKTYDEIEDELSETPEEGLIGLDLGVASSVAALAAAGCIPFTSCNAGAYGGQHNELFPLVAFYARKPFIEFLLACCERAGLGLEDGEHGCLIVYSSDIRNMRAFARELLAQRNRFREL
jgi:hypothetical protein